MERVMLTLPPDLLKQVDQEAQRRKRKRSQLVRQALQEWLERERQQESEALLAEGYQSLGERAERLSSDGLLAQAAAAEGIWRWDD